MLCVSNVIIFPYQKENILRRKWYVLNLVCFGSGTATFDKRGTIESEIEERCMGGGGTLMGGKCARGK